MTDTYKVLGQVASVSNSNISAYVVPENTQSSISSLSIVNSGATSTYTLSALTASDYESIVEPAYSEWSEPTLLAFAGIAAAEEHGKSVAISADGNMFVVGAPGADGGQGLSTGSVRIYTKANSQWNLQIINGESPFDYFGSSVSISADGNAIAIGAPEYGSFGNNPGAVYVYTMFGGSTFSLRERLIGWADDIRFGDSVALGADADTLWVGAPTETVGGVLRNGSVTRFEWNPSTQAYDNMGGLSSGGVSDARLGTTLAFSADGSTIAASAPFTSSGVGKVYVHRFVNGSWSLPLGLPIEATASGQYIGSGLDISADGNTVVIGYPGNATGFARIYTWDGVQWSQVANDLTLTPSQLGAQFGQGASISADGSIVSISTPWGFNSYGGVNVYELIDGAWQQVGDSIQPTTQFEFPTPVSLSDDGYTLVIGLPFSDYPGTNAGSVRLYERTDYPQVINTPPEKSNLMNSLVISSGAHHEISGGIQLSEGDAIVISSPSDDLIINIFGVEMS